MADEKGIKFYLISTEDGPQLEHLQAEAKKRDPNFQTIYVDTTKQPLMDRLNDLMRRAHGDGEQAPVVEEEGPDRIQTTPPPPTTKRPPQIERMYDQTGFEQFVWDMPAEEVRRLDTLEAIIKERRDEINGVKRERAPTPEPTKSRWGKKT